jgi:hypothetical protein
MKKLNIPRIIEKAEKLKELEEKERIWESSYIPEWKLRELYNFDQCIEGLRQWLNEDRITDPKKMVTDEELKEWFK